MGPKKAMAKKIGSGKRSRRAQLTEARKKRRSALSETGKALYSDDVTDVQQQPSGQSLRVPIASTSSNTDEDVVQSASNSKLQDFRLYRTANPDPNLVPTDLQNIHSFCLFDIRQLNKLLTESELLCPVCCADDSLQVTEGKNFGFSVEILLTCKRCDFQKKTFSSRRVDNLERGDKAFVVNDLAVVFSHEIGKGHVALQKFAAVFGMKGIHLKTYQTKDKRICKAYISTGEEVCAAAVRLVRLCYIELNDLQNITDDDIVDITVSFDGTWQKRGFTSLYGIGTLIEVITGYCIDFEIFSKYCHACALAANSGTDTLEWKAQHQPDCTKNYEASSKSMEASSKSMETAAALAIWGLSVERYKLRYTCVISDGDSTSHRAVCNSQPYGDTVQIEKMECANHCHKRMGTALRELAKDKKLGEKGPGRLTKFKCESLQNYYHGAIINNLNDIEKMREAIWASLFHCLSTDDKPHHTRCPPGVDSWCRWKRAEANGEASPAHSELRTALSHNVAEQLVPVYRRMSDPNLLKRLSHGKTQNANESLNNLIWVKCPKTVFVGKRRVDAACSQAVSHFNEGARNLSLVMENLGIEPSEITYLASQASDEVRIRKADRQSQASFVNARRYKARSEKLHVYHQEDEEGQTYGPGLDGLED